MKALSLTEPYASLIMHKIKVIETRTWKTSYRGDILICAAKSSVELDTRFISKEYRALPFYHNGYALCIASLDHIQPMKMLHQMAACCEVYPGAYAWHLFNIRPIKPFPVKGKLRLFEVDYDPKIDGWRHD